MCYKNPFKHKGSTGRTSTWKRWHIMFLVEVLVSLKMKAVNTRRFLVEPPGWVQMKPLVLLTFLSLLPSSVQVIFQHDADLSLIHQIFDEGVSQQSISSRTVKVVLNQTAINERQEPLWPAERHERTDAECMNCTKTITDFKDLFTRSTRSHLIEWSQIMFKVKNSTFFSNFNEISLSSWKHFIITNNQKIEFKIPEKTS